MSGGDDGPLGFGSEPAPGPHEAGEAREPGAGSGPRLETRGGPPAPGRARALPRALLLIAAALLLVIVTVNTLRTQGASSSGPQAGRSIPPFAAPLVLGTVVGDVNVARSAGQAAAGSRPACSVRGPGILNSCDLVRGAPAVIAFFAGNRGRCVRELDALARVVAAHPSVRVAAIAVRGDRGALRTLVRAHHWRFAVAQDRDGALANLYGVAVCPQLTFVLPGGVAQTSTVGAIGAQRIADRLTALERRPAR